MAPFLFAECPICQRRSWQYFLLHEEAPQQDAGCLGRVCEDCKPVLLVERWVVVGQHAATERDLDYLPFDPDAAADCSGR